MLLPVMREVKNFFEVSSESGRFNIENGVITLSDPLIIGQYVLVTGSILNDGVYLLTDTLYTLKGAQDEAFDGTVYGLRVPRDFVELCEDIEAYNKQPGANSNITSETVLGIHSWAKATGKDGAPIKWQAFFSERLTPFRTRMFTGVYI